MSNRHFASQQLSKILTRIDNACISAGRDSDSVRLVGASKKQDIELIRAFTGQGLSDLGENYLQEALKKKEAMTDANVNWHFIGHIQSNKTKLIAEHFDWVHGVDRLKIARRLSEQNSRGEPVNILLQINLDGELSKSGVSKNEAPNLCAQIAELNGITLRGLMLIPQARKNQTSQRALFALARELLESINRQTGLSMDQLSMGMSGDLEAAIAEGSTMVRIGTDLFGARV